MFAASFSSNETCIKRKIPLSHLASCAGFLSASLPAGCTACFIDDGCSAAADTHQGPYPDIHSGSSADPWTQDRPSSSVLWLPESLHRSANSLSEGLSTLSSVLYQEPESEIAFIELDSDFRWFTLDFRWKFFAQKADFFFHHFFLMDFELLFRGKFPSRNWSSFLHFGTQKPSGQIESTPVM